VRGMQLSQYFRQHGIGLLQGFIIPEAYYPKTFRLKICRSPGIVAHLLRMLPTIYLYDEHLLNTDKIDDVGWDRMLPTKLESTEVAIFQIYPQP